jgi:hypothetical protein
MPYGGIVNAQGLESAVATISGKPPISPVDVNPLDIADPSQLKIRLPKQLHRPALLEYSIR